MPGIFGVINYTNVCFSLIFQDGIYTTHDSKTETFNYNNHFITLVNNQDRLSSYSGEDIHILLEGVIFNDFECNDHFMGYLHDQYIQHGEAFVRKLRGSFHLVLFDARPAVERVFVYADSTASRQIFYAQSHGALCFAPDIQALIPLLDRRTENRLAMLHFLVSGHFPSGLTTLEEIRVLGPGEYLAATENGVERRVYHRFRLSPDERLTEVDASRALESALSEAIVRHWRKAADPAILLSGGYDSQFIFFTIAQSVEDTRKLTTVTWGQNPGKPRADMDIARRTARRFGTRHIEMEKTTDRCIEEYAEMFQAQSGMTDSCFYHANELTVCRTLRERHGIRSVMRGDECLGYGPDVHTLQNALCLNGMSFPEHVPGMANWLQQPHDLLRDYTELLRRLVSSYDCSSLNDLKDTIDFHERQHMNRNPLNYYKLHYQEVFCPLLDVDVLEVVSKLPARFRRHKLLFKKLLLRKYGRHLQIAEETNLVDWRPVISKSTELGGFFRREIQHLPDWLNANFFEGLVQSLTLQDGTDRRRRLLQVLRPLKRALPVETIRSMREHRTSHVNHPLKIPGHFLLIRAAVLARWSQWCLREGVSLAGAAIPSVEPLRSGHM